MSDSTVGNLISDGITVRDSLGALADVGTGPVCTVTLPDGTTSAANVSHVSTGTYSASFGPTTQAGQHLFVWTASGANSAQFPFDVGQVDVRPVSLQMVVSLADAKDHLNIPASDTSHDNELRGFIGAGTEMVAYWAGPIIPTTFTEVRDAGSPIIMLDNPPIISITSVTEYWGLTAKVLTNQPPGSTVDNYGYSLDDAQAGKLVRRGSSGMATPFIGGKQSVVIVYQAGLSGPVPQAIRMAALEDLRGLYQQTQLSGRPQFGSSAMSDDNWGGVSSPLNQFPRLEALMSGPGRTPSIA